MKVKKIIFLVMTVFLLFGTLYASAETVYREKYEGIGPYDNTPQELNVEGNELYYAKISGYKTIDEFSENEKITLYAGDSRTITVPLFLKEAYLNVGWHDRMVTTLYTLDGRQEDFYNDEVEAQLTVGWYMEKPVILYTLDGRKQFFHANEVQAQLSVGWYRMPPVTLYTLDGRSAVFPGEKADEQRKVGWYYKEEIEKMNNLKNLANSFYIGQKVWLNGYAYYPVGYVTDINGGNVSVKWNEFYDYNWNWVYNQHDILIAEMATKINIGSVYTYPADKINVYK